MARESSVSPKQTEIKNERAASRQDVREGEHWTSINRCTKSCRYPFPAAAARPKFDDERQDPKTQVCSVWCTRQLVDLPNCQSWYVAGHSCRRSGLLLNYDRLCAFGRTSLSKRAAGKRASTGKPRHWETWLEEKVGNGEKKTDSKYLNMKKGLAVYQLCHDRIGNYTTTTRSC